MSQQLPADLVAAAKEPVYADFYAVEIVLPSATIRWVDGAGFVKFNPHGSGTIKFTGRDPVFGVLESTDPFNDGFGDNAGSLSFTIAPATDGAITQLLSPDVQFSTVKVWWGVLDQNTGIPVNYSERFDGLLDYALLEAGAEGEISIAMYCITEEELFFRNQEGVALADGFFQTMYPGELGLQYVVAIQRSIIWGPGERPPSLIYQNGSYGGGIPGDVRGGGGGGFRGGGYGTERLQEY